jgi:hypothetical protein
MNIDLHYKELESSIDILIDEIGNLLPEKDLENINDYYKNHGEYGLSIEYILGTINECGIEIPIKSKHDIIRLMVKMDFEEDLIEWAKNTMGISKVSI